MKFQNYQHQLIQKEQSQYSNINDYLRKLFQFFAIRYKGYIHIDEFRNMVKTVFMRASDYREIKWNKIDKLFNQHDSSGLNILSFESFSRIVTQYLMNKPAKVQSSKLIP